MSNTVCFLSVKSACTLVTIFFPQCLVGDKYGYRPYPRTIEAAEFRTLRGAACAASRDAGLLDDWYTLDENAVPPRYVLAPITSKFPYYDDVSEENAEKREQVL